MAGLKLTNNPCKYCEGDEPEAIVSDPYNVLMLQGGELYFLSREGEDDYELSGKKEEYREIKDHYFHLFYNYAKMQELFGAPPQPYHFPRYTESFKENK